MELRRLTEFDMDQALLAHEELAAEQFDFLFSYDPVDDWANFLANLEATRQGRNLPDGRVPATFLIAEVDGNLVGRVSIRHSLNPFLRTVGGHIGYAVRPRFRRQGYAHQILTLSLVQARELGISRVLLTCDADNIASRTTIEKCGGALEASPLAGSDVPGKLRYWIDT
ncbi:GNAT family N-acetyltransferase [Arthrobacter sp. CAN_A214]|uniref:GNAT family N-acetyltransferase n=1 Tax=Arthrobacter sp. CAN_A214 TaxID=2787720 RepID=UPI0018CB0E4C